MRRRFEYAEAYIVKKYQSSEWLLLTMTVAAPRGEWKRPRSFTVGAINVLASDGWRVVTAARGASIPSWVKDSFQEEVGQGELCDDYGMYLLLEREAA